MTVSWNGSVLSIGAIDPADDFVAEVHDNDGTRVRVDFESPADEHRVEVRVDGGELEVRID